MAFAVHQHKSAVGIHISPPFFFFTQIYLILKTIWWTDKSLTLNSRAVFRRERDQKCLLRAFMVQTDSAGSSESQRGEPSHGQKSRKNRNKKSTWQLLLGHRESGPDGWCGRSWLIHRSWEKGGRNHGEESQDKIREESWQTPGRRTCGWGLRIG